LKPFCLIAAALVFAASSAPALASHARPGLWNTTTTMTMSGVQGMNMPPQTHSATFCMTAAEASSAAPRPPNPSCAVQNIRNDGHTVSADMVCHGQMEGTGHFSTTYDSDTHYRATMSMAMNGMSMNNAIEGKWLKADCAGASH